MPKGQHAKIEIAGLSKGTWKCYAIIDPQTHIPGYIGVTQDALNIRLNRHLSDARDETGIRGSKLKNEWLRDIMAAGQEPYIAQLQWPVGLAPDDWERAERFWIAAYRAAGFTIFNESEGGAGNFGVQHSEESRAKTAASMAAYHANRRTELIE